MLAIVMLLILAINGGLFVGTILHSVQQRTQLDRLLSVYQNFWS